MALALRSGPVHEHGLGSVLRGLLVCLGKSVWNALYGASYGHTRPEHDKPFTAQRARERL